MSAEALQNILSRISSAAAAHSRSSTPRLVAVSKLMPSSAIETVYTHGQRHFGENYVQEIIEKAPILPADIQWHFIGHLQSNKCKNLVQGVPNLFMVESVDSEKCARELQKACAAVGRPPLRVLVQVNTSDEDSKSGISAPAAISLAQYIRTQCPLLEFCGLMTIGKLDDPDAKPYFRSLAETRKKVSEALGVSEDSLELSMGMSGDFEDAIALGSTNVRVGSSIFGARPKPAGAAAAH